MPSKRTWVLLLVALAVRLAVVGWDAGVPATSLHPDERQVAYVTERLDGWFADPGFFAYGSLHFQMIRLTAVLVPSDNAMRQLIESGRLLSVAASMLALALGWWMARRAWGRRTADLFLLIAAFVPLDIQQSHFATVEAHHTAWIMLALAACFRLAEGGGMRPAAAAGAAVGASLAVKVASLALGLPLALALVMAAKTRGVVDRFRLLAVALSAGVITFWLCQPWAFAGGRPPTALILACVVAAVALHIAVRRTGGARLGMLVVAVLGLIVAAAQLAALTGIGAGAASSLLIGTGLNPAYLAGVGEQVRMVMGEADLPYVRVFVDTLPVLYPLGQLGLWGWGPLLLGAAIAGAVAAVFGVGRRWRRFAAGRLPPSTLLAIVVLAWLGPMAFRLSTLYVKFLRYWEPLVVPAALVAAWWLMRLPRRFRRRAILTVVAGTALWGAAYLWAFVDPHPHGVAARWLSPLLADGQRVAFESWDETIGLAPDERRVTSFSLPSYDLPDDEDKVARWLDELAGADWVVMTSNRVMRTVLANPHRFERTDRLYRLLLAGELGFEPMTRAVRGPRLFGLRWPVQCADESFVNYEFPQVLILRRVSETPIEEIADRVSRPLPFLDGGGLGEIQRSIEARVPVITPVPTAGRQLIDLAAWLLVFAVLGASTWVAVLPLVRGWPDAGVGLAAATGWIVPAWLVWLGSELGYWRPGAATVSWVVLAAAAVAVILATRRWREIVGVWRRRRRVVLTVLAVGLGIGALFLIVRAWNPAIHWGEKPMDFSFLNAFLRAEAWPTDEPWMAGMPLHYYYFGEVLAAFPILAAGCTAGVGYNLMAATVPAMAAMVLAAFGLVFAGRRGRAAATVLPLLVMLTGNLAWPWLLDMARDGKWFDLWWATSRVIPGFAIDEYPLWTAIFADLHGHFIALPVMVAALAWGWTCVHSRDRRWWAAAAMTGIVVAVLVATNPWDLAIFSGSLGAAVLLVGRQPVAALSRLAVAAAASVIAAAPFIVELIAGFSAGAGSRGLFLTVQDFAPAWAVVRHFGVYLIPLAVLAVATVGRRRAVVVTILAAVGVAAGLSFGSSAAALALALAAFFLGPAGAARDRWVRLAWVLAAFALLAVAACERFTLIDRMNTIFKVYNGVWLLLAGSLATLIFRSSGGARRALLATWAPLQLVAMVNLPLGIGQGWVQPRMSSPRPTLDGQAFLRSRDPETWFLVRALQAVARPGETVAESAGNYYSRNTRIVMHTGQPTVVGWEWHLTQRGQDPQEIRARFDDLAVLYSGRDPAARREVLDRYRVRWVVLGDLERQTYGLRADARLDEVPGVVAVAADRDAALYLVLPDECAPPAPPPTVGELPDGVRALGRLPKPSRAAARAVHIDGAGALVTLADGGLAAFNTRMSPGEPIQAPPCEALSAVRFESRPWVLCADGPLMSLADSGWRSVGRLRGAAGLTADRSLWAWGPGGMWRLDDGAMRRVASGPIAAAAANGVLVAWSDGASTWVGRPDGRSTPVAPELTGVTALAWQGPVLYALDSEGLHRSGGGVLPWRRLLQDLDGVDLVTAWSAGLWLVLEDGTVAAGPVIAGPSPWTQSSGPLTSGLRQPRGIAVSPGGWFAVVDTMNHRVRWYSNAGVLLDELGGEGDGEASFSEPSGLDRSRDGRLAVADTWNGRVVVIHPDGATETVGERLFGPREALWSDDGSLFVADTGNRRLVRFLPPDWKMEVVAELDAPVVGLVGVGDLLAVATPAAGSVVIVEPETGAAVRTLEMPGWALGEQQEGYLVLLPSGELAASAPSPGEIWVLDPNGSAEPRLLRGGLPGVTDLAIRSDGRLLASLTWDHRLIRIDLERAIAE